MTISMYQASVPVFIRALEQLSRVLNKGKAYAESKKIKPEVFPQSRIIGDMLPLISQIQIATDTVKFAAARLAGQTAPSYEDNEQTLEELEKRIAKTVAYLKTFTPAQIDGSENKAITVPRRTSPDLNFNGIEYLLKYVLPNLFFHVSIGYAILRKNGVELGKKDYLGEM